MTHIAVSGSTAYDYIMNFHWNLANEVKSGLSHKLDVAFRVKDMKRESGGTGLNLCYNLAMLGTPSILLSSIWEDFSFPELVKKEVELDYVHISAKKMTSCAYVTSDADQNQISAFHSWAMDEADSVIARNVNIPVNYWVISANKKEAMLSHMKDIHSYWVKLFFHPGAQLHEFSSEELALVMKQCNYLLLNDHEYSNFKDIVGLDDTQIFENFDKVIITYWGHGSKIFGHNWIQNIPVVWNHHILDRTWVGDAFLGGLISGLNAWNDWEKSARMWSLLASFSLWSHWAQNHFIDQKHFQAWYTDEFGEEIQL